jgi:hypothetical protein
MDHIEFHVAHARNPRFVKEMEDGGEGGIRTHGRISPTHAFQACSLNRSDTSPLALQTGCC